MRNSTADSPGIICSKSDDAIQDGESPRPMALIDVDDLIGYTFETLDEEGKTQQNTIIEALKDHHQCAINDP